MKNLSHISRFRFAFSGFILLMPAILLSGCFGAYGSLRGNPSTTLQFKEVRVPQEYRYYYDGREFMPYAVIGIRPDIRFNSRIWTPVDPKDEKFKRMLNFMYFPYQQEDPVGSEILDPQGRQIGIWYSTYRHTAVKAEKDGSLSILSPYVPESEGRVPF
ncbi:MAG: hypothetical protein COS92_04370 [Desulfobacterales bacterium CG07_land_8_20_14_0_80_52_14]|nr:MAG: hypothetical protein COX20_09375 [Desulfobacterales bacterium CG23_combo_of_CG06-09_8_20_14_all_52_9]PIU49872.1 MAG: hypothetical protein COS92_04370 [Desulfobacterales bacterium CG07_land_8_20_14_0_80_52_14]